MIKQTKFILLIISLLLLISTQAQKSARKDNSKKRSTSIQLEKNDTLSKPSKDSLGKDSLNKKSSKNALDAVVKYQSKDSIVFIGKSFAKIYGDGKVEYKDIELKANYIQMSLDSSLVYAKGAKDTAGKMVGEPVFKEKSAEYNSKTMRYNFKSKRGYITQVVTEQGEGFVIGGKTKKMENDVLYMTDCKYTTCQDHEHPHFYFQLTKAKVRPKKNIVTGPAYLVLEDVPLPLAIPFGFFPFSEKYSSGVLVPTFGEELTRGFFLREGGYYFAINDYVDLALRGEIYTKGSWGVSSNSSYTKKYRYSGSLNAGFRNTVFGDKGAADYSVSKDFNLNWTHSQDSKANPNMTFSASVNFSTSSYDRNDFGGVYDARRFTQNNKSSSVNLTKRFPNSPFTLSSSMNINQHSSDSSVSIALPNMTIMMSRVYPFKRKNEIGEERWYEKIGLTYNGVIENSINTKEKLLFQSNLIRDWRNGIKHSIPVSSTFNLLKYINITPSFNYDESWFSSHTNRSWDAIAQKEVRDTVWGFNRMYRYSSSISASTKMYGFFKPLPLFGDKIKMIRHVFTPSLSFSYSPNFQDGKFGFWRSYKYYDAKNQLVSKYYSPYEGNLFYSSPGQKTGSISFIMSNNLEMKIKSDQDSTGERKISLIENFTTGVSYNIAADSMRWSDINASIRLKLTKTFTINLSGNFDTYTYKLNSAGYPTRVNVTRWEKNRTLGRLTSTGTSFSYTFNNETFKKLLGEKSEKKKENKVDETTTVDPNFTPDIDGTNAKKSEFKKTEETIDKDGYMNWRMPWSLSFNYSMRYGYADFNTQILEYNRKITHSLGFTGTLTLTQGWSFNMSSTYDFDAKQLAYTNINISRDLHCWQMSAGVVPFGPYRTYNFNIAVKSSLLKDVKYDKRGGYYNAVPWY